jgi:hypothetical protein
MENVQTRIPAYLWDSLQNVMYEHDYQFLREISALIRVPVPELKRTILGARGALTSIVVAKEDTWWEHQVCPYLVRNTSGVWSPCGKFREPHGACMDHRSAKSSESVKHRNDAYFQSVKKRHPFEWNDEIVWVCPESGDVVNELGDPIPNLTIDLTSGIVLPFSPNLRA